MPTPSHDPDEHAKGPETRAEVDDVVQHTDSGSGASQREHWPANVDDSQGDTAENTPAR